MKQWAAIVHLTMPDDWTASDIREEIALALRRTDLTDATDDIEVTEG